jgi:hypothetical protein
VRYVAALRVRDHEEAGGLRRRDDVGEGLPAAGAEQLEAGDLWLDGDAGRSRCRDQLPAPLADGLRVGGLGVEPKADLASPLLDEGGEPVCEGLAQVRLSP